jgi:hypothetical protein
MISGNYTRHWLHPWDWTSIFTLRKALRKILLELSVPIPPLMYLSQNGVLAVLIPTSEPSDTIWPAYWLYKPISIFSVVREFIELQYSKSQLLLATAYAGPSSTIACQTIESISQSPIQVIIEHYIQPFHPHPLGFGAYMHRKNVICPNCEKVSWKQRICLSRGI